MTLAKNHFDSWFLFLSSHSTSNTSSQKEGARSYKITRCVQGICQGLAVTLRHALDPSDNSDRQSARAMKHHGWREREGKRGEGMAS